MSRILRASRVKVVVEIEAPEGDDEGVYRDEFRRELAKRIVDVLLDRDTVPAREVLIDSLGNG